MTDLLIIALATWYVSYTLTSTHGPGGVFEWVRKTIPHNGLLDCPVCLAFWAALVLLLMPMGVVIQALAVAGAAMLAHSASGWRFGG